MEPAADGQHARMLYGAAWFRKVRLFGADSRLDLGVNTGFCWSWLWDGVGAVGLASAGF